MEIGLLLIFWYGILHAFAPDHLAAIADFSIGKGIKRTMFITFSFAVGHGIMLFIFAKMLQSMPIPQSIALYGDKISSSIIIAIGIYILYMVITSKIHLQNHFHNGEKHIHISFGKTHEHTASDISTVSAFSVGALMGLGGVRGMLVTLGMLHAESVSLSMVAVFILGVTFVFCIFGLAILAINKNLLTSQRNVRRIFTVVGIISLLVGGNMLLA